MSLYVLNEKDFQENVYRNTINLQILHKRVLEEPLKACSIAANLYLRICFFVFLIVILSYNI